MFGTGNEPTTLTDNRIQALLNRGYIAYNTGSYKNSKVGEIESDKKLTGASSLLGKQNVSFSYGSADTNVSFYPKTNGSFQNSWTDGKTVVRQANHKYFLYAKVSNLVYTSALFGIWDTYNSGYEGNRIAPTISNDNVYAIISPTTDAANGVTTLQLFNTNYNTLTCEKMIILDLTELGLDTLTAQEVFGLLTSTDINTLSNGDAISYLDKIKLPGLLELNGAINSHDTFEITNTGYVFTRNVWKYTFTGNENFTRSNTAVSGVYRYWFYSLSNVKGYDNNQIGDVLCDNLTADTNNHIYSATNDYSIGIFDDGGFDLIVKSVTDVATMQSFMNGKTMYYPLATPQVITIPRKHLGCIDLGSLSWTAQSSYTASATGIQTLIARPSAYNVQANIYCGKYKSAKEGDIATSDMSIAISTSGVVLIKNSSLQGQTAQQIKSALAGVYLFYETDAEVSDLDNIAQINAGGSITSNSEVLPNVSFKLKCK